MRKADIYKKINRNSNIYNQIDFTSPRSILNPGIHLNRLWVSEDDVTATGVQIIELNSSDNPQTPPDAETTDFEPWSFINRERFQENNNFYEANNAARERRRLANQNQYQFPAHSFPSQNDCVNDFGYSGYYAPGSADMNGENVALNHQMNCFTIIDKRFVIDSEMSSADEYDDIEEIKCNEVMQEYSRDLGGEIVGFEPDLEMEKRTIFIYSFKNKHLLSEDDYELVNIPSRDATSSSCSIDETDEPKKPILTRLATPLPSSLIPRLNLTLTPTLPTLTEVTEPNRQSSSNQTEKSLGEDIVVQKPLNNWFMSENATPCSDHNYKLDKSTSSVINWMALSPREKRRRFRNISTSQDLPTLREASTSTNEKTQNHDQSTSRRIASRIRAAIEQSNSARQTNRSQQSDLFLRNNKGVEVDLEECKPEDRGDHKVNAKRYRNVPQIRFSPKPITTETAISDPIEKLDSDNWIDEGNAAKEQRYYYKTEGFSSSRPEIHGDCAGNTLLIRNMSLLRPAHWAEYLPITGSLPSLHLSFASDSVAEPHSWFERIRNCFRCCK